MARLGELYDLFDEFRVDKRSSLVTTGKRLQSNGLISVGKRGRGSAELSWLDAARYTIAVMATDHPEQAVGALVKFGTMPLSSAGASDRHHGPLAENVRKAGNFEGALACVLEDIGTGEAFRRELAHRLPEFEKVGRPAAANAVAATFVQAEFVLQRAELSVRLAMPGATFFFNDRAWQAWIASLNGSAPLEYDQTSEWRTLEQEMRKHRHGKNLTAIAKAELLKAIAQLIARKAKYA